MHEPSRHLDLPRGFHDSSPEQATTYERLRREWFAACALSGYQSVEVPPVGFKDTFTHGHHAAGDRLYPLPDRRGRSLALVSDSLPAVLRLSHARGLRVQRLSYCCPVFRYVRRPRRYFHHLGLMETVSGPTDLRAQYRSTSRLAQIVATFLAPRLKPQFTVADPGMWRHIVADVPMPNRSGLLDELRRRQPHERPDSLKTSECPYAAVRLVEVLARDPRLLSRDADHALKQCPPAIRERVNLVHQLAESIRGVGVACDVDLGSLHASEFHDGPAFQVRPEQGRLLGDGGTYDGFASIFVGGPTSACSAIIGLERLADLQEEAPVSVNAADVATLAHADAPAIAHADALGHLLRQAGIRVWDAIKTDRFDHHLREIAAVGIPFVIVVGIREVGSDACTVRAPDGTLHEVSQQYLPSWLADRLRQAHEERR